jgi:peroxiredoxin
MNTQERARQEAPAIDVGPAADESSAPTRGRRAGRVRTIVVLAAAGAAILAAVYLTDQPAQTTAVASNGSVQQVSLTQPLTNNAPEIGKAAPVFSATTADGKEFNLADLRGKAVWLTFGATWCQPCRAENPDIEAAFKKYADQGLVVVQVYLAEDAAKVNDYGDRVGITYTRIPDPDDRLAAQYRILGIPSHFFIDRDGTLRELKISTLTPELIEQNLAVILK